MSKPLVKLSNHLSQVHHFTPKERAKYLGMKRKFASQKDIASKTKRTTALRRSQRTLHSLLNSYHEDSEAEYKDCSGYESEAPPHVSECDHDPGSAISDHGEQSLSDRSPSSGAELTSVFSSDADQASAHSKWSIAHSSSVQSSVHTSRPVQSSSPLSRPVQSSVHSSPPVRSSADLSRPVQSSVHSSLPVQSDAPLCCPVQSNTYLSHPVQSSAHSRLPVQSNVPSQLLSAQSSEGVVSDDQSSVGEHAECGRTAGRFPLNNTFLVAFSEFLSSRTGGKKSPKQVQEICTDVSKYLWFANRSECDSTYLLSRVKIRQFVDDMETGGIGPSGLLTKLRRILMGIRFLEMTVEDMESEVVILERASVVKKMINSLCASLGKEKASLQAQRLETFARSMPDLSEVTGFITSPDVDAFYSGTVGDARKGVVSTEIVTRR